MPQPLFPGRGDVFLVDFSPTRGSEQGGTRPALIVSNDVANQFGSVVTVVALTRTIPKKQYPQNVALPEHAIAPGSDAGTVFCSQMITVSKDRLGNFMGRLDPALMGQVDDALRAHLAL